MKKSLRILLLLIIALALVFLAMPAYVKKAVWYFGPSIYDYKIFENRVIRAGKYQPWKEHANYNAIPVPDSIREIVEQYRPIAALVIQNEESKLKNLFLP